MTNFMNSTITDIAKTYGTPCWVYDAETIVSQINKLKKFDVIRYAQKANSNLSILKLMKKEGVVLDSVSLGEIERAIAAGYEVSGENAEIVFTADLMDKDTLDKIVDLNIPVNVGSPQMISQLGERSPNHPIWLRINPGFGHGHTKKTNTGGENSKHGLWYEHLQDYVELVNKYNLNLVGLHMHIGSGTDYNHLQHVCQAMVETVKASGQDIKCISAGGGLSVPYQDDDKEIDCDLYYFIWDKARRDIEEHLNHEVKLEIEPGRFLVANSGILISEVRAIKPMGNNHFVLVDAGFNDLMRPSMYGSRHRMTLLSNSETNELPMVDTIVGGPLCESGDVFTQELGGDVYHYPLPQANEGDFLVFHEAGAYGASMSSNYNSRTLCPEVLVNGADIKLIRRRQDIQELISLEML